MSGPVPVVVMGLGPVGRRIAREALGFPAVELVAAVDIDPHLADTPLANLIGGVHTELAVTSDIDAAYQRAGSGFLLQATGSRLCEVAADLLAAVRAGLSVISTCPELSYPWLDDPQTARQLDRAAREARGAILGAGVNPGFALDWLVACAGLATGDIRHVHAKRSVDISNRRAALLRKAGVGLPAPGFRSRAASGAVGHIGLHHSAALAVLGLGLSFDEIDTQIEPVISDRTRATPVFIEEGCTAGYEQTARAIRGGTEIVRLDLCYAVGAASGGSVVIDADPRIELTLGGDVSGDAATAWSVLNAVPRVTRAGSGLLTVLDLPAGFASGSR